ncbi:MAG: ATP-binding cassette domain-containing protein [Tissierellia bacterium]|nr:ATP-binding cassette domain-containing protein [Tissierellia bacterium]
MKLQVNNLEKYFGEKKVLNGVSFEAESGKAFGFLGRNGAGKTTTIRIIMDVFKPNSGEITIDGEKFNPKKCKVGYLPEERGLYSNELVYDQLFYFSRLKGAKRKEAKEDINYWLERFGLMDYRKEKLGTLSKGNQQKVQIIEAILNDPEIFILDEPFSGLDPVNSMELRKVIKEFIKNDKIVIFSSHQMSYVEEFCEKVAIIEEGTIVMDGNLKEIKEREAGGKILLNSSNLDVLTLREKLLDTGMVLEAGLEGDDVILKLRENVDKNQLLQGLLNQNIEISKFSNFEPSLQDIFVSKVGVVR